MFTTHDVIWTLRNKGSLLYAKLFPTPYQNQREKFSPLIKVTKTDLPKEQLQKVHTGYLDSFLSLLVSE